MALTFDEWLNDEIEIAKTRMIVSLSRTAVDRWRERVDLDLCVLSSRRHLGELLMVRANRNSAVAEPPVSRRSRRQKEWNSRAAAT